MKQVYFVYQDEHAFERQSDGVEFCIIDKFYDDKIYFFCAEYQLFWSSIDEVGNLTQACDFALKKRQLDIRPATLIEISEQSLIQYISTIKEYDWQGRIIKAINYIHL